MHLNPESISLAFAIKIQVRVSRKLPTAALDSIVAKVKSMAHVALEQLSVVVSENPIQPPDGSYVLMLSFEDPALQRRDAPLVTPVGGVTNLADARHDRVNGSGKKDTPE